MPKDKYVYPVPPQEENEKVSAQTQNDEINENPENGDQEQMITSGFEEGRIEHNQRKQYNR